MLSPINLSIIIIILLIILEIRHNSKPTSPLKIHGIDWKLTKEKKIIQVTGWVEITNQHKNMEVMIPSFKIKPVLLGKGDISKINVITKVIPYHPDADERNDNYWAAYILKARKKTKVFISFTFDKLEDLNNYISVENIWIEINWINYGPFGRLKIKEGFVFPIKRPERLTPANSYFKKVNGSRILPIKTHMLGTLDDIEKVMDYYTSGLTKSGDILTIGESPLAILQGRYINPSSLKTDWLTRLLCKGFHPTSSLATACGMQSLINIVGPTRIILSLLIGSAFKLIGIKGMFYRLAGDQARLIDDITGTTPPYDQTIVLGPKSPNNFCNQFSSKLGISIAIVDVNDLGRVKILASSKGCNEKILKNALISNPAGNANEQTPLVLIRPLK